ncbi:MAG TPA: DUF1800 domain-containing protein [Bacteroidota bacterium]|nr:DUF1800 domain-containing protein [Bacteroidota bacterium]
MNRRSFISTAAESVTAVEEIQKTTTVDNRFANKALPDVMRTTSGLEEYTGVWGFEQVAHLLRRTMFAATKSDITDMTSLTLDEVVDTLLTDQSPPDAPLNTNNSDTGAPVGQTWVNAATNDFNNSRIFSLKAWWIGLMLNQSVSLREKMTLFWHNHFVTESIDVRDARVSYRENALLRQNALGNFKELTKQVTIHPAMLRYLNGNTNTRANPNENYARELQELFTIGKGPEIGPGNYTNYTEDDVKAAARVLTGWRDDPQTLTSTFVPNRHDPTNKQFSSAYGSWVIIGRTGSNGALEVDDLLDMIFDQDETAKFICRKLYRWFVYYVIDNSAEENVINPLAEILRNNNYDVKPVLKALFKSAHFFDSLNMGCMIKNPVDFVVGMSREFALAFPPSSEFQRQYNTWRYIHGQAAGMQMDICDPPNVAGWSAYYQVPQYYQLWINSDTLPKHNQFTDTLLKSGYTAGGFTLIADPIAFSLQVSDPTDPNILVSECAKLLFPIEITENQKTFLKNTLIPGLPDYEWTSEWNDYINDPTNLGKRNAVRSKLQSLLSFMLGMAEYQLS